MGPLAGILERGPFSDGAGGERGEPVQPRGRGLGELGATETILGPKFVWK